MTRKLLKPSDFPMARSLFDDDGIYASSPELRSIALQVLEQERRDRAACRRAATDDCGQWGIWNISDRD
tara:strand:- start:2 stop:208 length:207 start_codon:yes stop_codon:yes gene_type:complete